MIQEHNPVVLNRRQALIDGAAFVALVGAVGGFAYLVEGARETTTRLSSEQERYLKQVCGQGLRWTRVPDGTKELYVARTSAGESISVSVEKRRRSYLYEVIVSESERPFHFCCTFHGMDIRERPLVKGLLSQASQTASAK